MALLEICNITKKYNKRLVIDDISFDIEPGDVIGIMGENGAGKSTLISMLVTLIKPSSGDILFNGESIIKKPKIIRGNIGYVPQDIALYQELSGIDNLKYWGRTYHLTKKELDCAIQRVIDIIELDTGVLKRKVLTYSGGMKRRLNIGIALLNNPEIIIMDEPTVGVDIISKEHILNVINRLNKEGKTIVYTSHYFDELEQICNKVCIVKQGRIMEFSDMNSILNNDEEHNEKRGLKEYYLHKYQGNVFLS